MRLKDLAATRVRFGYRRLTVLLRHEGWAVNAKQVYRIYKQEGLMVRTRVRKKIARRRPVVVELATGPNQRWCMDFVHERLEDGRKFRILTVGDEFTRECIALHLKPRLQGADVAEALDRAFLERDKPISITVDNFAAWLKWPGNWLPGEVTSPQFARGPHAPGIRISA